MRLKPGDIVMCVDPNDVPWGVQQGELYVVDWVEKPIRDVPARRRFLLVTDAAGEGHSCFAHRFVKVGSL